MAKVWFALGIPSYVPAELPGQGGLQAGKHALQELEEKQPMLSDERVEKMESRSGHQSGGQREPGKSVSMRFFF